MERQMSHMERNSVRAAYILKLSIWMSVSLCCNGGQIFWMLIGKRR